VKYWWVTYITLSIVGNEDISSTIFGGLGQDLAVDLEGPSRDENSSNFVQFRFIKTLTPDVRCPTSRKLMTAILCPGSSITTTGEKGSGDESHFLHYPGRQEFSNKI
jgi:hypothetical protein